MNAFTKRFVDSQKELESALRRSSITLKDDEQVSVKVTLEGHEIAPTVALVVGLTILEELVARVAALEAKKEGAA